MNSSHMKEQKNLKKNYIKPQLLKMLSSDLFLLVLCSNQFAEIGELFHNKDVFDPIVMNDLIQVTNRTMLMATINHMSKKGYHLILKVIQSAITD